MATVADVLAGSIADLGCSHFFQVTGSDPALWFALRRAGVRMVPARTEHGAVYMADGAARMSGRPAFAYAQHGPGFANACAAMAEPYWSQSGVITVASAVAGPARGRVGYQELDQPAMSQPVTKAVVRITGGEDCGTAMAKAYHAACSVPCGPVHVEVPRDVLAGSATASADEGTDSGGGVEAGAFDPGGPESEPDTAAAAGMLADAVRPLVIAGSGAVRAGAFAELYRLAELLDVPVATTLGGKGAMPEHHRLALGVVGRYGLAALNDVVREADVVLAVGTRLGELSSDGYRLIPPGRTVIQVDADKRALGVTHPVSLAVRADAKAFLGLLTETLLARGGIDRPDGTGWARTAARRRDEAWREAAGHHSAAASAGTAELHPADVVRLLAEHDREDVTIVADTGYMAAWTGTHYRLRTAGLRYLRANGSLGWAIPASIGAALVAPDRRIVTVTGDGGAAYNIMELETAVRCNAAVLVVMLNNRSFALERHVQLQAFGTALHDINDFVDVDYAGIATALGAHGRTVTDLPTLDEEVRGFLTEPRLTLLDVRTDASAVGPVTTLGPLNGRRGGA